MLIGEYIHTLDEKNRVSLPVKFRKEMGRGIVITPGLDSCLFIFTIKQWEKISAKLAESSLLQTDNRRFNRFIFGGAQHVDVDASGRILIPDFLKQHASLGEKIALIGVQDRIEVWNEAEWQVYKKNVEKEADALAEKLGSVGVL